MKGNHVCILGDQAGWRKQEAGSPGAGQRATAESRVKKHCRAGLRPGGGSGRGLRAPPPGGVPLNKPLVGKVTATGQLWESRLHPGQATRAPLLWEPGCVSTASGILSQGFCFSTSMLAPVGTDN